MNMNEAFGKCEQSGHKPERDHNAPQTEQEGTGVLRKIWNWVGREIAPEFGRLARQGAMELASALHNGSAFTPYGPGAYTKDAKEHGMKGDGVHGPIAENKTPETGVHGRDEQQHDRSGRGM